ncbi:MAG: hypothetical protein HY914_07590 [Desulfomonile tiedjei]|nr:hypothetical protein [Desulfomonile tiedjei]
MANDTSRDDAVKIIEKFESLPLEKRLAVFQELTAQAREELIRTVTRPGEIVRSISEEEMYFTVKELGEGNAPALVSRTTGKQLTYFLDLDLWKLDMFDAQAAGRWLEILAGIGEEKIQQFIQVADPELIFTAIRPFVRVQPRNPEVDLLEEQDYLPSFTLDDTFFVEFLSHRLESSLKIFLDAMFRWDQLYYFTMMEQLVMGGSSLENEEMALKWRRARLADKGFPDIDEAIQIYQYLRKQSLSGPLLEAEPADLDAAERPAALLAYPLKLIDAGTLFKKCLDEVMDQAERDRLSTELAHMGNKVMVADGRDPGSIEDLQGSLKKVAGYINIALEELCGDDCALAAGVMRSNHMEFLFRRGFSLILDLRKKAQEMLRGYEGGPENLGHPLAAIVQGLLEKRPLYAGDREGDRRPRDFQHLAEIEGIREMMDRAKIEEKWEPI